MAITVNLPPSVGNPLAVLLGLLLLVGFSFLAYNDYMAFSAWNPMNAVVDHSNIIITKNVDNEGSRYMFQANISYTYTIDGKAYAGHCCSSSSSDNSGIQSMVDRNSAGKTAEIMVNPSNPYNSRLKEDISPLMMFVEIIVALIGLVVMLYGIKQILFPKPNAIQGNVSP